MAAAAVGLVAASPVASVGICRRHPARLVAPMRPVRAHQLVAAVDELLAVWSADLDRLPSADHVAVALDEQVVLRDAHLPTLQVRHPVPGETARAGTAVIERDVRHRA